MRLSLLAILAGVLLLLILTLHFADRIDGRCSCPECDAIHAPGYRHSAACLCAKCEFEFNAAHTENNHQ